MENQLKILYISSEVAPFAKTGGLADVAGSFPKYIKDAGHDIRILVPKYKSISERKWVLRDVIRLREIEVPFGKEIVKINVKSAFLPGSKVQVYFVSHPHYFGREGFYIDPQTNQDYPDNGERFAFFSKSAFEILKTLHWQPDIIHCNDWQTALIPYFLKYHFKNDPFFENTKTLLTLHNLAFQGIFEKKVLSAIGIALDEFKENSPLEFWGKVNFLKAGILTADFLSTVSKTYAKEIQQSEEYGFGLQDYLKKRKSKLVGITNGVDYGDWDPEKDKYIPVNYSLSNLKAKLENKKALLQQVNLPFDENIPVIGMVARLTEQKGIDLLCDSLDDLLALDIQLVILGLGETKYQQQLAKAMEKHSSKMSVDFSFDEKLAHLIEAGSDLYLMPSKFEPCGLNQIYSLKYGTIPIVRATGGLADTVVDYSEKTKRGTGFMFHEYSSAQLIDAVNRAIAVYKDKKIWKKMVQKAMKQDFSWQKVLPNYLKLYERML